MKHIVITGIDGTGKSSMLKELVSALNLPVVSIWDSLDSSEFNSKGDVANYLISLTPNERVQFMSSAYQQSMRLCNSETILHDSYFYKYFATELTYGADPNVVRKEMNMFPKPSLVFRLLLPVEACLGRKGEQYTHYECGLKNRTPENYLEFQKKVLENWEFFSLENWISIDSSYPINTCVFEIMSHL